MAVCLARISRLAPVRKVLAQDREDDDQDDQRDEGPAAQQELGRLGAAHAAGPNGLRAGGHGVTSVVLAGWAGGGFGAVAGP